MINIYLNLFTKDEEKRQLVLFIFGNQEKYYLNLLIGNFLINIKNINNRNFTFRKRI